MLVRVLTLFRIENLESALQARTDPVELRGSNLLAILQLAKEQRLTIEQDVDKGEIQVELAEKHSEDLLSSPASSPPPLPAETPPPPESAEGGEPKAEDLV